MDSLSENILAQIEKVVESQPDALIALLSTDGVFLYISPSVESILGWPRDLAMGHNIAEHYTAAEVAHINLTIQDALLRDESIETSRNTPIKSGGVRRMRGAMRKIVDDVTGNVYVLSISRPREDK